MADAPTRWEPERADWIRSRQWMDRAGAARRAALLSKRARQLGRDRTGRGRIAQTEADLPGLFRRWTDSDDSLTSALGAIAFVLVFGITIPSWLGAAWVVGNMSLWIWELAADRHRVRVWVFPLAAIVTAVALVTVRHSGLDRGAIVMLASALESATGGFIAPAVLSQWYAAGIIAWLEIQIVLGLLYGGWLAWVWGWAAPTIRRDVKARTTLRTHGKQDKGVRIISSGDRESPRRASDDGAHPPAPTGTSPSSSPSPDPMKIISRPSAQNIGESRD